MNTYSKRLTSKLAAGALILALGVTAIAGRPSAAHAACCTRPTGINPAVGQGNPIGPLVKTDLTILSFNASCSPAGVLVNIWVQNDSSADAPASLTTVWIDGSVPNASGYIQEAPLTAGSKRVHTLTLPMSKGVYHNIGGMVDAQYQIDESNESNNFYSRGILCS